MMSELPIDKVNELIDWVATRVGCYAFNKPWCSLNEEQQNQSIECTKQIFSHPDLALIVPWQFPEGTPHRVIPLAEAIKETK